MAALEVHQSTRRLSQTHTGHVSPRAWLLSCCFSLDLEDGARWSCCEPDSHTSGAYIMHDRCGVGFIAAPNTFCYSSKPGATKLEGCVCLQQRCGAACKPIHKNTSCPCTVGHSCLPAFTPTHIPCAGAAAATQQPARRALLQAWKPLKVPDEPHGAVGADSRWMYRLVAGTVHTGSCATQAVDSSICHRPYLPSYEAPCRWAQQDSVITHPCVLSAVLR